MLLCKISSNKLIKYDATSLLTGVPSVFSQLFLNKFTQFDFNLDK